MSIKDTARAALTKAAEAKAGVEIDTGVRRRRAPTETMRPENATLLDRFRSGDLARDDVLAEFVSRSAEKVQDDRGLIDMARRRDLNLAQFFTPLPVARFMAELVGLDRRDTPPGVVLDNSCGIGRLFAGVAPHHHLVGVEPDSDAFEAARVLFPKARLHNCSMVERWEQPCDAALLNPPFGLTLETPTPIRLACSRWGKLGRDCSFLSQLFAVETACLTARLAVVALLPAGFDGEEFKPFRDRLSRVAQTLLIVHLPPGVFSDTAWPTTVRVYLPLGSRERVSAPMRVENLKDFTDPQALQAELNRVARQFWSDNANLFRSRYDDLRARPLFLGLNSPRKTIIRAKMRARPTELIVHGGRRYRVAGDIKARLRLADAEMASKVAEHAVRGRAGVSRLALALGQYAFDAGAEDFVDGLIAPLKPAVPESTEAWTAARRRQVEIMKVPFERYVMLEDLRKDHAAHCAKLKKWDKKPPLFPPMADVVICTLTWKTGDPRPVITDERIPTARADSKIEAAIKAAEAAAKKAAKAPGIARVEVEPWVELHAHNGVRIQLAVDYRRWRGILARVRWPLWEFQADDCARLLAHGPAACYNGVQATGKTRIAITYSEAISLCHPHHRDRHRFLVLLEAKLIDEWLAEAEKVGLPRREINIVTSGATAHPSRLRRINLVAYTTFWRPAGHGFGAAQTIVDVLRRTRFTAAFVDEAHRLSGGITTKQGAASFLIRAKRKIELTGTFINNFPRNGFPLGVWAWGEGTPWNEYGYHAPYSASRPEQSRYLANSITSGTRGFGADFVRTEWVTEQFADTLQTGRKAKEIPILRAESLPKWHALWAPRLLRRTRQEPLVRACAHIPEGVEIEIATKLNKDHAAFYRWWLEDFFDWFTAELEKEKQTGQAMQGAAILAQLTKLRVAATIPQSRHMLLSARGDRAPPRWAGGLTPLQDALVSQLREIGEAGSKVIVFSERPELLNLLYGELANAGVGAVLFHGDVDLKQRMINKSAWQTQAGISVLLMSRECGNTGYNLDQADCIVSVDRPWVPAKLSQANARMLRAAWYTDARVASGAVPTIYQYTYEGTVEQYLKQWVELKAAGIGQAIDHKFTEDFDPEAFMSYRDFTIKMFEREGFDLKGAK